MMLAGAALTPMRGRTAGRLIALCLSRSRPQWPFLAWAVTLAEVHGLRMKLATGNRTVGEKLGYRSAGEVFLRAAYERWYPPLDGRRVAVTPPDVDICEQTLAVWIAAALARRRCDRAEAIGLRSPCLSEVPAAHISGQIRNLGWNAMSTTVRGQRVVKLDKAEYGQLLTWLRQWIPEPVWA